MKRIIALGLVLVMVFALAACNSSKLDDANTAVAEKAIAIADKYLDADITGKEAAELIDPLRDQVDDPAYGETLGGRITHLYVALGILDDVAEVKEQRNKIAELAGIKKR